MRGANLEINDSTGGGKITQKDFSVYGSSSAIYIGDNSSVTMNGGEISGYYTDEGVVEISGGTFTLNDGCIKDNCSARDGGGLIGVFYDSTLNVNGGTISNNIAGNDEDNGCGDVIYLEKCTIFNMTGGSIINNTVENTTIYGDRSHIIYKEQESSIVYISGNAVIKDNTDSDGNPYNLFIDSSDGPINVGELKEGAEIHLFDMACIYQRLAECYLNNDATGLQALYKEMGYDIPIEDVNEELSGIYNSEDSEEMLQEFRLMLENKLVFASGYTNSENPEKFFFNDNDSNTDAYELNEKGELTFVPKEKESNNDGADTNETFDLNGQNLNTKIAEKTETKEKAEKNIQQVLAKTPDKNEAIINDVEFEDNAVPLANIDTEPTEKLAITNIILSLFIVALMVIALLTKEKPEIKLLSVIPGIIAAILIFVTQKLDGQITAIDQLTPIFLLLFVICGLITYKIIQKNAN